MTAPTPSPCPRCASPMRLETRDGLWWLECTVCINYTQPKASAGEAVKSWNEIGKTK